MTKGKVQKLLKALHLEEKKKKNLKPVHSKKRKTYTIKLWTFFKATTYEVFMALTDTEQIEAWSGSYGKVCKEGGHFEMFDDWVKGKVLVYKQGKELSYTWKGKDWKKEWEPSTVHWRFRKMRFGSKAELVHSGLPTLLQAKWHKNGWKQYFFRPLRKHFKMPSDEAEFHSEW